MIQTLLIKIPHDVSRNITHKHSHHQSHKQNPENNNNKKPSNVIQTKEKKNEEGKGEIMFVHWCFTNDIHQNHDS